MPRVSCTDTAGTVHALEGDDGMSVMVVAVKNGVPGIVAECGGSLTCASCHVYVADEWMGAVGPAGQEEDAMLDGSLAEHLPGSRLSCQLVLGPELDGLQVTVAPAQL